MGLFIKNTGPSLAFAQPNDAPLLIVGLGNIGDKYKKTRHNAGFLFLDYLKERHQANYCTKANLEGDLAEADINERTCYLFKPATMMNLSGRAVQKVASYYKIPAKNIIVVHDELDLDFGQIRSKFDGGHAGHNGLRSLFTTIGPDFYRIRIGVKSGLRDKVDASDFVLMPFSKTELKAIDEQLNLEAYRLLQTIIDGMQ